MASEAQHQAYVIKWSQQPSIRRQWPELALLHHIPNGGTRDAVEAKHLKQQGVKSGVPDLCLPVPRGQYHGLYTRARYLRYRQEPMRQADRAPLVERAAMSLHFVGSLIRLNEHPLMSSKPVTAKYLMRIRNWMPKMNCGMRCALV